ncbi:hypothetical protein JCM19583_24460 [Halopiger thermotolerans]
MRKLLLLSLGLAAVAYAASRYIEVPDEFEEIPIGEREADVDRSEEGPPTKDAKSAADEDVGSDADVTGLEGESGTETDAEATDVIDDSGTNDDITDEERSPEEISERADENVPDPGEMSGDDELVGEEDDSSGGEASDEE